MAQLAPSPYATYVTTHYRFSQAGRSAATEDDRLLRRGYERFCSAVRMQIELMRSTAKRNGESPDFVVFPEVFMPRELLPELAEVAKDRRRDWIG